MENTMEKAMEKAMENTMEKAMEKTTENTMEKDTEKDIEEYLNSLSDIERMAYDIAKRELKSSFIIEKTIGYKEFLKSKQ